MRRADRATVPIVNLWVSALLCAWGFWSWNEGPEAQGSLGQSRPRTQPGSCATVPFTWLYFVALGHVLFG